MGRFGCGLVGLVWLCLCLLAGFSSLAWFDLSGTVKNSVLCYLVFWYIFCKKGLCIMVAASHCSCFSYRVGRGQGSAAGAAEDHMTCMLDAYKCMGANVLFVCFARETLGTKNAKCKRGCSFSFASETLGTKKIKV